MEEKIMFSAEYNVFSTKHINIKFRCTKCNTYVQKSISEIPTADLAGGDTHRTTLNSDSTIIECPNCGSQFIFLLGSSCCGGEIDCNELEQDDVEIEIIEE